MAKKATKKTITIADIREASGIDKPLYTVTFTIGGVAHVGEGNTAFEALNNIKKPAKISLKSTLHVRKGNLTKIVPLNVTRAKRLFYSPLFQKIQAKTFDIGLKAK